MPKIISRTTYDIIIRYGLRQGTCPVCGKRGKRSKKFLQTVNPYNRRADGRMKTHTEVTVEIARLAREWSSEPFCHIKCEVEQ